MWALFILSFHRSASARPATATTVLSGTMGISDWTFIFPESGDEVNEDTELNLPTLDDFDLQIAVFEARTTVESICIIPLLLKSYTVIVRMFPFAAVSVRGLQKSSTK